MTQSWLLGVIYKLNSKETFYKLRHFWLYFSTETLTKLFLKSISTLNIVFKLSNIHATTGESFLYLPLGKILQLKRRASIISNCIIPLSFWELLEILEKNYKVYLEHIPSNAHNKPTIYLFLPKLGS